MYGLMLMVIVLASNQQLLKDVEVVGNFFLDTMAIMFLPGTIGIMNSYSEVSDVILPILTICILSTIAVMCATGRVSQKIIQKEGKSK